jgi:uncharacterized membrane protein YphA (DoxX/SURF4 family)
MTVVRALARPLLSAIFIVQGAKAVKNPDVHVEKAKPVADRLVPLLRKVAPAQVGDRIPENTKTLVRLNGAAQVAGGVALASGSGRRLGALVLAGSLVPTTLAQHRFWEESDPASRASQQVQFLQNIGLLGGLLLAAVDTEGKPGVLWRTTHSAKAAKRGTKRGAKLAKREARQAVQTAAREAVLATRAARREARSAARAAKAELPFG